MNEPSLIPSAPGDIGRRMRFDTLRYAAVWEDIALLYEGLEVRPSDDVLSITSAGDNVLGLLLKEPRSITALDLNACQSALLELKLAALRVLDHASFVGLLGVRPCDRRIDLYEACRPYLSPAAAAYWDAQSEMLESGLLTQGRLERYILGWQEAVLHRYARPTEVSACTLLDDPRRQQQFFEQRLGSDAFRAQFTSYFGRERLAAGGRDPAQFAYVEIDAGAHFYERFRYAFTQLPLRGNPYLEFFLTGRYRSLERVHPYLRRENYARLRRLAGRVRLHTEPLEAFLAACPPGALSKANLSDVFEYVSAAHAGVLFRALHRALRPGGRLAYWSLLVDRSLTPELRPYYRSHAEQAHRLWLRDRAWFYRSFHLEEAR